MLMDNTQNMKLQEKIFLAEKRTNQNLHRMILNIEKINTKMQFISSIISRLGILKKYSTYNIRYKMIMNLQNQRE